MNKKIYSLLDKKVGHFLNPLVFKNDAEAMRWFQTVINSEEDSNPSKYPEDFSLYYLGSMCDQSGQFHSEASELCAGLTVKDTEVKYTIKDIIEMIAKREA